VLEEQCGVSLFYTRCGLVCNFTSPVILEEISLALEALPILKAIPFI
jgi:hypothetical protein